MENIANKTIKQICLGVGVALLLTIVLLIIYAVILTFTEITEDTITPTIIVITGISILTGSVIGNSKVTKNGIINGASVGFVYVLIIYLISSLLNCNFSLQIQSIIMIISAIRCGIIGGIIGVNKKT